MFINMYLIGKCYWSNLLYADQRSLTKFTACNSLLTIKVLKLRHMLLVVLVPLLLYIKLFLVHRKNC
jgi:hypothetical protein